MFQKGAYRLIHRMTDLILALFELDIIVFSMGEDFSDLVYIHKLSFREVPFAKILNFFRTITSFYFK